MRELTYEEMEQVDGGIAPLAYGVGLAVVGGAINGYDSGGWPGALVGGTLAVPAALFGGIAASTYGAARVMFSAYSLGTGWLSNRAANSVGQAGDS